MRRRRGRRQKRFLVISVFLLLVCLTIGYAAFSTDISITVRGNVKDLKAEVDGKVPLEGLLFWGQADNEDNSLNIFKDKSENNNDGLLYGFDNTINSGYNEDDLIFDGINDYIDLGFANYDFENSISYVMYVKILKNDSSTTQELFGNWDVSGGGIYTDGSKYFAYDEHDGTKYNYAIYDTDIDNTKYYTLIGTYDGTEIKLYVDGLLQASVLSDNLSISSFPILIGANPDIVNNLDFANMALKEAMLYDRALDEDEVKTITSGFERKYG